MLGVVAWAASVVGGGCEDAHALNVSYIVFDAQHVLDLDERAVQYGFRRLFEVWQRI